MAKSFLLILISILLLETKSAAQDSLVVMFWNLENFFDYTDGGGGESDREFSSSGSRHWTKKRFSVQNCSASMSMSL